MWYLPCHNIRLTLRLFMNLQCARKNYKDRGGETHIKGSFFHFCALLLRHPHRFRLLDWWFCHLFAYRLFACPVPPSVSGPPQNNTGGQSGRASEQLLTSLCRPRPGSHRSRTGPRLKFGYYLKFPLELVCRCYDYQKMQKLKSTGREPH